MNDLGLKNWKTEHVKILLRAWYNWAFWAVNLAENVRILKPKKSVK